LRGETDDSVRLQLLSVLVAMGATSTSELAGRVSGDWNKKEGFYRDMVSAAASSRVLPRRDQSVDRWG